MSQENIITFLPNSLPSHNKNLPRASNAIPYPELEYLFGSSFLVNLATQIIEFPNEKSAYCINLYRR